MYKELENVINTQSYSFAENYIKAMIRRLSIGSGCICKSGKCKLGQPGITLAVGIVQQIGYRYLPFLEGRGTPNKKYQRPWGK